MSVATQNHGHGSPWMAGRAPRALLPALGLALLCLLLIQGCHSQTDVLGDGFFTAMADGFDDDGWKDFLTIYVNNGSITTAEFNAFNEAGLLRSWDTDYMRTVHRKGGLNPNYYPRKYCSFLVAVQDPSRILPIEGGAKSHEIFLALAKAAIDYSRQRKNEIAEVRLPENGFPDDV
ncbi:MAG: FMN-binding protein [Deltaproteobacteria bacterium]|nr:FMN-binding protein [Deltaproteobacteria bacterium]